jgi:hypothetical protein
MSSINDSIRRSGTPAQSVNGQAYVSSLVAKNKEGILYSIMGFNSGPAQFIFVHDDTGPPANGAVPSGPIFAVPTNSNFSLDFGDRGRLYRKGICICNSTTSPTYTAGAANCWFEVELS